MKARRFQGQLAKANKSYRGDLVASFFVSGFCCLTAAILHVCRYRDAIIASCVVVLLDVVRASSGVRKYAT